MADKKKAKAPVKTDSPAVQQEPKTEGKTIDERMAALLEDHKRMGSR